MRSLCIYIYIMYIQLSETLPQTSDVVEPKHLAFFSGFLTRGLGIPNASATLFPKHGLPIRANLPTGFF